jgi:hypothetical protein
MGSSSSSSQETSQQSFPQWTQDAQQNTFQMGTGMLTNFLRNPKYSVAGFTPDALKGFDLARDTARTAYTGGPTQAPNANTLNVANVTGADIQGGMNPFLETVGNRAIDAQRREYANTDAALASKYAAAGAMGGSGEAIARGQAARGFAQGAGDLMAQLMAQGYDKATALALANQQAQGQNAGRAMQSAGLQDQFRTTQQAREMSALNQLLQGAGAQQGQAQRSLDVPWTALERLLALTPKQTNSQTVSNKQGESNQPLAQTFGQIAGGLGSLATGGLLPKLF